MARPERNNQDLQELAAILQLTQQPQQRPEDMLQMLLAIYGIGERAQQAPLDAAYRQAQIDELAAQQGYRDNQSALAWDESRRGWERDRLDSEARLAALQQSSDQFYAGQGLDWANYSQRGDAAQRNQELAAMELMTKLPQPMPVIDPSTGKPSGRVADPAARMRGYLERTIPGMGTPVAPKSDIVLPDFAGGASTPPTTSLLPQNIPTDLQGLVTGIQADEAQDARVARTIKRRDEKQANRDKVLSVIGNAQASKNYENALRNPPSWLKNLIPGYATQAEQLR